MCTYLHKAPNGVYYFRMGIPAGLRSRFGGKREIKHSLKTKDRHAAKLLIPDHTKAARKCLAEAQAALSPPPARKSHAQLDRERERWEREQEQGELASAELARLDFEAEDAEPLVRHLAQRFASQSAELSPIEEAAKRLVADARFELELANERLANQQVAQHKPAIPRTQGKGIYLDTDIVDGWAAERQARPKSKLAYSTSAKLFDSIIGRKSVEQITRADVMAFKNRLIADHKRSQINVRDHLGSLRTLLAWAAQADIIPANPANDVRMLVKEQGEGRKAFNINDLNVLFAGPVHARGERPKGSGGEAAYWLPLLALFTGARREELGQLRVSDVRSEPYFDDDDGQRREAWCLDITDETRDGLPNQIKNESSRRLVPLHPTLIELGFIRYVQALPNQNGRVFPELKPSGVRKALTDKWGQWFTQYRRACGIIDKGKVFHSFRHTFKDFARTSKIAEGIQRQIMGHEGRDVADQYGAGFSFSALVDAMASYRVPGLVIPAPARPISGP